MTGSVSLAADCHLLGHAILLGVVTPVILGFQGVASADGKRGMPAAKENEIGSMNREANPP